MNMEDPNKNKKNLLVRCHSAFCLIFITLAFIAAGRYDYSLETGEEGSDIILWCATIIVGFLCLLSSNEVYKRD